ncbi:hypothetical protein KOR34_01120 [Posidoniimonas corsicana]|uniref:Uncharacterized protein n=1 Tax=Posidoniimonas corsicana TaxID=1938618 RepID=A0A5C5V9H0_9BACT|nr:hypothetical protein [Posidoniimonas corsicana]TWT35224.1 hypothetical protein KOR34_01120 [Posidoniimonas corsicana]
MTYCIPPEYEHVLSDSVARGGFASPDEALRHALELLAAEQGRPTPVGNHRPDAWAASFRRWAEGHPSGDHHVDADRQSIYDDRGV